MHIKDFIVFTYIIMYIMLIKTRNNRHFHYHYPVFLQYGCENWIVCDMHIFPKVYFIFGEQWSKKHLFLSFARKFYIKYLLCQCSCSWKDVTEKRGLKWEPRSLLSSAATQSVGLESIIYWFLYLLFHFWHFEMSFNLHSAFTKRYCMNCLPILSWFLMYLSSRLFLMADFVAA